MSQLGLSITSPVVHAGDVLVGVSGKTLHVTEVCPFHLKVNDSKDDRVHLPNSKYGSYALVHTGELLDGSGGMHHGQRVKAPEQMIQVAEVHPKRLMRKIVYRAKYDTGGMLVGWGQKSTIVAVSSDIKNPWVLFNDGDQLEMRDLHSLGGWYIKKGKKYLNLLQTYLCGQDTSLRPGALIASHLECYGLITEVREDRVVARHLTKNSYVDKPFEIIAYSRERDGWLLAASEKSINVLLTQPEPVVAVKAPMNDVWKFRTRLGSIGAASVTCIASGFVGSNLLVLTAGVSIPAITFALTALRDRGTSSDAAVQTKSIETSFAAPAAISAPVSTSLAQRLVEQVEEFQEQLPAVLPASVYDAATDTWSQDSNGVVRSSVHQNLEQLLRIGSYLLRNTDHLDTLTQAETTALLLDHLPEALRLYVESAHHAEDEQEKEEALQRLDSQLNLMRTGLQEVRQAIKAKVNSDQQTFSNFLDAKLRKSDLD